MNHLEYCVQNLERRGLNRDGNKFEICWEKNTSTSIEVKDAKVDTLTQSTDQGISIRVLKDGKIGFSYTFDQSNSAIDRAIETALQVAELMPQDEYNDLNTFGEYPYADLQLHDESGLNIQIDAKIDQALALESELLKKDRRIKRVRAAGYDETDLEIKLIDTNSEQIQFKKTIFANYITCVAEENGASEMGSDSCYGHFYSDLKPEVVIKNAAHNATELLNSTTAKSCQVPAVFKNSIMAQIIGFLSASFSAENIDKKVSLLLNKCDQKIFSEKFNLIDDGLISSGIASYPFDGEGIPMKKTGLIEDGVLKTYLYDSYYARKYNVKSTASSRRGGLKSGPSIGHSNLILKQGNHNFNQLILEAQNGIYITQIMGLHTANPITGDFSVGASGILIENGKLTKPVKGFAVAGNLLNLFNKISQVGSDNRNFGTIQTPSVLFSEISIGGS